MDCRATLRKPLDLAARDSLQERIPGRVGGLVAQVMAGVIAPLT
jgi:hypothetical protein